MKIWREGRGFFGIPHPSTPGQSSAELDLLKKLIKGRSQPNPNSQWKLYPKPGEKQPTNPLLYTPLAPPPELGASKACLVGKNPSRSAPAL